METERLHPRFGAIVHSVDLNDTATGENWSEIRALFEQHSLLMFRNQSIDDGVHMKLNELFGPVEVRAKENPKPPPIISKASNVLKDSTTILPDDQMLNNLKANMLWHTDSIFLPVPALVNILRAEIVPTDGGETEFTTTRAAYADMPKEMRAVLQSAIFKHRYSHSRAKIDPDLADEALYTMWEDTRYRALWRNPVTGEDAVYIASHTYGIKGWEDANAQPFINEVIAFCTQPEYVYSHEHKIGDVLMWDERAILHRGMPWPYDQPRTLASACSSVTEADGLLVMRPDG